MFCKQCGKEIPDNSNFCTHCGASQAVAEPAPQPEAKPQEPQDGPEPRFDYDFTCEDDDLGMVEKGVASVLGEDEPEEG